MKLTTFNGGLNTRLVPHLIGVNEAPIYINLDNETGVISPVKQKLSANQLLLEFSHFFTFIQDWVTSAINRDYVEYRNTLFFTEDNAVPQKTTDGVNFFSLGIVNPIVAPVGIVSGGGPLTGTYQYLVTFYNSSDDTESGPSPLSNEIVAVANNIDLTTLPVSTDPQVDLKRIYRIGGNLTLFTLVAAVPNAQLTYLDIIADSAVEGSLLESALFQPALSGLKFLSEHYGIFMAALNDRVYFTPVGRPNAWPVANFIDFDSDVTGIGKVLNGVVIFTLFRSYIITGTSITSFVKNTLSVTQGCREHKTIQEISDNGQLLWVSNDGICSTNGSSVQVITKNKLGKLDLSTKNAVVHDEVYYLQKSDRTVLAVDTRYGLIFKDLAPDTTRLVIANDILYGFDNNTLFFMFASTTNETYTYLSANFTEGSYTNRKAYKHFYIRSEGSFTISILVDGITVLTKTLSGTETHDIEVPQDLQNGYSVQLSIIGTAVIHEIEWKALARRTN